MGKSYRTILHRLVKNRSVKLWKSVQNVLSLRFYQMHAMEKFLLELKMGQKLVVNTMDIKEMGGSKKLREGSGKRG